MTLAELHERIGWQLEGRLQHKVVTPRKTEWEDVPLDCDGLTPSINGYADWYRSRPDAPPMPDEVWIAPNGVVGLRVSGTVGKCSDAQFKYIRADGIIDGARLQWRPKEIRRDWRNDISCEYRFKP